MCPSVFTQAPRGRASDRYQQDTRPWSTRIATANTTEITVTARFRRGPGTTPRCISGRSMFRLPSVLPPGETQGKPGCWREPQGTGPRSLPSRWAEGARQWPSPVLFPPIASERRDRLYTVAFSIWVTVLALDNSPADGSSFASLFPSRQMNPIKITRLVTEQTLWHHKI